MPDTASDICQKECQKICARIRDAMPAMPKGCQKERHTILYICDRNCAKLCQVGMSQYCAVSNFGP